MTIGTASFAIDAVRKLTASYGLGEDACRIRRNPGVFTQLRHFALNLLRHNGETNIRAALFDNALDLERLLNYKGIKN